MPRRTTTTQTSPIAGTTTKPATASLPKASHTGIPPLVTLTDRLDEWAVEARSRAAGDPELAFARGQVLLDRGNPQEALKIFDQALRRHPDHFELLVGKAAAHTLLEQFKDAADTCARAVAVKDDDASVWFNYAVSLTRLWRFGPAGQAYQKVLALQPDHAKAMYNLASLYQRDGRLSDALRLWERCTELSPALGSAWFHRGAAYLDLKQYTNAATCFEQVARLEPDRADGWENLGVARLESGMLDEAIAALEKSASLDPKQITTLGALGRAYARRYKTGTQNPLDRHAAIRRFGEALTINPDQPELQAALEEISDE